MLNRVSVVSLTVAIAIQLFACSTFAAATAQWVQSRADRAQIAGIKAIIDDSPSPATANYVIIVNEYNGEEIERQSIANPIASLPDDGANRHVSNSRASDSF